MYYTQLYAQPQEPDQFVINYSVCWNYIYVALHRFGFNCQIIDCLKSLYTLLSARIKVTVCYCDLTNTVKLERGCRQGCPLSPTLFALFIEPLAQAIREHQNITGITMGDTEFKIRLYADDVLVTMSNPNVSLPNLLNLLQNVGTYSGYKLNLEKTQILLFNYTPPEVIQQISKFNWEIGTIKYLCIAIPKDLKRLFKFNYNTLTSEIRIDICWSRLPMTLYNRIDVVKMNLLPRLLYLFQVLPINKPNKQFRDWDKMISKFIWGKVRPRIKFTTLQIRKEEGGLKVPHLENYYKAAQVRWLIGWCDPGNDAKWKKNRSLLF